MCKNAQYFDTGKVICWENNPIFYLTVFTLLFLIKGLLTIYKKTFDVLLGILMASKMVLLSTRKKNLIFLSRLLMLFSGYWASFLTYSKMLREIFLIFFMNELFLSTAVGIWKVILMSISDCDHIVLWVNLNKFQRHWQFSLSHTLSINRWKLIIYVNLCNSFIMPLTMHGWNMNWQVSFPSSLFFLFFFFFYDSS